MNEHLRTFDLAIIGAGPGGYVAAICAAQLKAKVALVEKWEVGGVCLNTGCIPTKVLISAAHALENISEAEQWGIKTSHSDLDLVQLARRKQLTVKRLTNGVRHLLKNNKVELFSGEASFFDSDTLHIQFKDGKEENIKARKIIIAAGSVPVRLSIPGCNLKGVMDSTAALEIDRIPKSMMVIGGGYIGCEFASIYRAFGTKVTIVEMLSQILPGEDEEIVCSLKSTLQKKGIDILTDSKVTQIQLTENDTKKIGIRTLQEEKEIVADKVLVSVGRRPQTHGLNLEGIGVRTTQGQVLVDECLRTNLPNVFAIGDCIGNYLLAHVASMEGEIAVENALFNRNKKMDYSAVPRCIFTIPEIGSIGISEKQAQQKNIKIKVGRFPFLANGKAQTENQTEGMVKTITDENGRILGAHILGNRATDLIAQLALAMRNGVSAQGFIETIHAHPTLPEAVREAFLKSEGRPLHVL